MNKQERKEIQEEFNQEIKDLYDKGIKVVEISMLRKITRARVYQILGLNTGKKE